MLPIAEWPTFTTPWKVRPSATWVGFRLSSLTASHSPWHTVMKDAQQLCRKGMCSYWASHLDNLPTAWHKNPGSNGSFWNCGFSKVHKNQVKCKREIPGMVIHWSEIECRNFLNTKIKVIFEFCLTPLFNPRQKHLQIRNVTGWFYSTPLK